jgi:hypothetical protein
MRVVLTSVHCVQNVNELAAALGVKDVQVMVSSEPAGLTKGERQRLLAVRPESVFCIDIKRELHGEAADLLLPFATPVLGPHSWKHHQGKLTAWLSSVAGAAAVEPSSLLPSAAFERAAAGEACLLLAEDALLKADRLVVAAHLWANAAAEALSEFARRGGRGLDPVTFFHSFRQDLDFAPGGNELWKFEVVTPAGSQYKETRRHLLLEVRGWRPRPEVPRVYFETVGYRGKVYTAVLYCGPHPASGSTQRAKVVLPTV